MTMGRVVEPRLKQLRAAPGLSRMDDDRLLGLFIDRGDEAAFEVLVARHAPRVLGVCRQVLRRPHDVEDVFQSTFLVLARDAAKIRKRASLGHWLHGVAHRLAVRSKCRASRRGVVEGERQGVAMAAQQPDDFDLRDVRRVVHEEIDRLPEKLRRPILLCYLEGLAYDKAARHLGCPPATLKDRLSRARAILHGRLARRGVALSAALIALILPGTGTALAAYVPRRLVRSTVVAVMAAERRQGPPAVGPGTPPRSNLPLALVACAALASGALATAVLYLSTPERMGFCTWFLGAVRRACH